MELTVHPYFLEFKRPFQLAHGTRIGTQLAFVKIEYEGNTSWGEASLPPYLPETIQSVERWVMTQSERTKEALEGNPFEQTDLVPSSRQDPAASAALQTAILRWHISDQEGLINHFGPSGHLPSLTLTVTKSDYPHLDEKLKLAKHFTHLKLKLTGQNDDLEFVEALTAMTDMPFCADLNQGLRRKEDAARLCDDLDDLGCILIEQPLPAQDHDGHFWLKERVSRPIVADESIKDLQDLEQYHEAYSGVNVKLMKCGGLFQAQAMIAYAKDIPKFYRLLGCMSESTLGVGTAAVLANHCDIADLDAPYLSRNDPFSGYTIENGRIRIQRIHLVAKIN